MQFLNPTNDVAFKKIFGSEEHKGVTISFLNSILEFTGDRAITDVQFLNTEKKGVMLEKKDNILDILCIDQKGNRYIFEVQIRHVNEEQLKEAGPVSERMAWIEDEFNAYHEELVRAADRQGMLEFAIEDGSMHRASRIALKLLKKGIPVETIANATDLSIDQIEELKKQ